MISWWTIPERSRYSSAMPADRDHPAKQPPRLPREPSRGRPDLAGLPRGRRAGEAFNKVSREAGLADLRDWLVLALSSGDGTQRNPAGHRDPARASTSPPWCRCSTAWNGTASSSGPPPSRDRRVRIPQATPAGVKVVKQVAIARDAAINDRLAATPPQPSGPASTPRYGRSWKARQRGNEPRLTKTRTAYFSSVCCRPVSAAGSGLRASRLECSMTKNAASPGCPQRRSWSDRRRRRPARRRRRALSHAVIMRRTRSSAVTIAISGLAAGLSWSRRHGRWRRGPARRPRCPPRS